MAHSEIRAYHITDDEENAALKAAKVMGLGVAGVDMLQSARGPLILEVNSSPGLKGIEKSTGKNVANSIIEFIEKDINKRAKTQIFMKG